MTKAEWLSKNGFNEDGITYIYFPADSYNVKETLKENGFIFSPILLWHIAVKPEKYAKSVIEVNADSIIEFVKWGEGLYKPDAKMIISNMLKAVRPEIISKSNWVGEIKQKISFEATVRASREMLTQFGYTRLIKFEDDNENKFQWWTASAAGDNIEVGVRYNVSGTIKNHDEFRNEKITVLTRCKFVEV